MASNYWMKLWIEVIDDPKMGRLSDNLWRRFFECCLIAKELNQGGRLPTVPDVAWRLRVDQETLELEFDQMARVGLIEYIADQVLDGHWLITNFVRRQSKMNPSERMRRKREQDRKRDGYGTCYEPVTVRNTETETETEKETETEGGVTVGLIYKTFENNFQMLTATNSQMIGDDIDDYSLQWVYDAMLISIENNIRKWSYVRGILKRWKVDGKQDIKEKKQAKSFEQQLAEAGYK